MCILESLQPNRAEICCTQDVLHIEPQSKNTLYPKVKFRTDAGNTQTRSNRELSEYTDSEREESESMIHVKFQKSNYDMRIAVLLQGY